VIVGRRAALSHPGRKRRRNEDAYVVQPPLFAIADGMGGAQAGELASQLAAAALKEGSAAHGDGSDRLNALVQEANRRVYQRSSQDPEASGMGTTVTAALVDDRGVWIGHVGDSRAYLLRDGRLEQLTNDHSLVAELVRSGELSEEEAQAHPQRSVITRAVGTDADVDVDTFRVDAQIGDVFLLCSDGLTDMVGDEAIATIIERNRDDLDAAAHELIAAANRGGGEDNITVVFFEVSDAERAEDATVRMPAVEPADAAEEDTLDEPERVPAVDTMVIPPEEAASLVREPEPNPQPASTTSEVETRPERSRPLLPLLALLLVVAVIVALVVWGVWAFT
jgi:PPM family protein phosphatase